MMANSNILNKTNILNTKDSMGVIKLTYARCAMRLKSLFIVLLSLSSLSLWAIPLDLRTFNKLDLGLGSRQGIWNVNADGTSVTQTQNNDPSVFLSPNSFNDSQLYTGQISPAVDNDFVGFVFGFQNTGSYYLLDWILDDQNFGADTSFRGITLKRIDSEPANRGQLSQTASVPGITQQLFHQSVIRDNNVTYAFSLLRDVQTGEISIDILDTSTNNSVVDFTVFDSTYTSGQFGLYTHVQIATFSNLTATSLSSPVPEPACLSWIAFFSFLIYFRKFS